MTIKELEEMLYTDLANNNKNHIPKILKAITLFSNDDISSYRNGYGETLAQTASIPSMPLNLEKVALAFVKKMDLASLYNVDNDGNMLIFEAVHHPVIFKEILHKGFNPEVRNSSEITLFATVAEYGYINLLKWLYETYPSININDAISDNAIFLAAMNTKNDVVKYLLSLHVYLDEYWLKTYGEKFEEEIKQYYTLDDDYKMFLSSELNFLLPQSITELFIF